jgi:hypothetical protein
MTASDTRPWLGVSGLVAVLLVGAAAVYWVHFLVKFFSKFAYLVIQVSVSQRQKENNGSSDRPRYPLSSPRARSCHTLGCSRGRTSFIHERRTGSGALARVAVGAHVAACQWTLTHLQCVHHHVHVHVVFCLSVLIWLHTQSQDVDQFLIACVFEVGLAVCPLPHSLILSPYLCVCFFCFLSLSPFTGASLWVCSVHLRPYFVASMLLVLCLFRRRLTVSGILF